MRRMRIYLDTSVISHLDAPDTPEKMRDTIDLWGILIRNTSLEVVISRVVLQEIADCPEPKRSFMVNQLKQIKREVVSRTDQATQLAEKYMAYGVLSRQHFNDLLHIALASLNRCNIIASWNFKHFVNYKTMDGVNAVHLIEGYEPIRIASPSMIIGELDNE